MISIQEVTFEIAVKYAIIPPFPFEAFGKRFFAESQISEIKEEGLLKCREMWPSVAFLICFSSIATAT